MTSTITWQYGSSNPENATALETIRQWWAEIEGQEISWQQRLIPETGDLSEINWESQKFDEVFMIVNPELRGITLYWSKPKSDQERSITPSKLELDPLRQQLYVFSQSQTNIVIRVEFPQIKYQTIEIKNPEIAVGKSGTILVRDSQQLLEVKISLTPEKLEQLKAKLT
ncbi:hypothetical protein M595_0480 [Lyngbya aestuarii BL J]|uniref:Uncharacterized protein n=1 Tax=Lyngbya aestuarii BL J TaxID=1348334 RepID=U7QSQ1_9CYAN|nr:hypothetical protein [Lyngbya aestuarii]ERT09431.1 hypothetical protein M595_0480 [Lyngbya aestuarii BL J]